MQKSRNRSSYALIRESTSNAEQYCDMMPNLFSRMRKGSWIIMNNGGVFGDILDSIVKSGNRYITRVKMNISDDIRIRDEADRWEYVEDGMCYL